MEKARLALAAALLAVSVSWIIPAQSIAVEEAAGMWCAGLCHGEGPFCGPSALEGCLAQFASCTNSHNSGPVGVRPSSGWAYQECVWITSPGGIWPGGVTYACPSGYLKQAVRRCVALDELEENERPPCREPAGSGASPSTPNPISLLTGSKLLRAADFETADGLLRVSRSYRSTPVGRAEIVLHEGAGLGSGWRFDFLPEFHIRPSFSSYKTATLHWPDGSSWDFRKDNDPAVTTMVPIASSTLLPHSEFRVIFDGVWPSDLTLVDTTSTQWKVIDPDGNVWIFATTNFIDEDPVRYHVGLPLSKTTPAGYRQDYSYGAEDELTGITDSFGRSISLQWILFDPNVPPPPDWAIEPITPVAVSAITLPDATSLHYSFEPSSATAPPERLVHVEHLAADGITVLESTTYHHENANFPSYVTGITDSRGVRAWDFAYDGRGRAVSSAKSDGADAYTVTYSPKSQNPPWREVTNPLGRTSRYRYSSTSITRLVGIDGQATTNCPADAAAVSYFSSGPSAGYIASKTDQEGRVTSYVRDGRGRPTTITEATATPDQRVTSIAWHATYDVPTSVARPGLTTTSVYNATGALTSMTQTDTTTHTEPYSTAGQTRTWAFTYTPQGLLDTVDGPLAGAVDVVDYDYDANGYVTQVTNELGHVTDIVSVNGRGLPTEILDPNGVTTLVEYDDLGRVASVTRNPGPSQAETSLEYDAVGDITKLTRPDGSFLSYTYDGARRVTAITSDLGETITYDYNNASQPISVAVKSETGAIVASRTLAYDEIGRVLRLVGAGLQQTGFSYDKVDNRATMTDPRGGLYQNTFDKLDRLISQTDPELGQTSISYDPRDNVTAVEDAENLSTTFVRNGFGDVIRQTSPDTGVTDYVLDARGLVTSTTDARGVTTEFIYDALGRVLTKSFSASPTENITYQYDDTAGGNFGVGRLTGFTDPSGSAAWRYDPLGRIVEVAQTILTDTFVTGYAYDGVGRIIAMTYPSGRVVTFTRDATGRVTAITTQSDALAPPQSVASAITYQPFYPAELFEDGAAAPGLDMPHLAGLSGLTHANGLALLLNYDADGRLTGMRTAGGLTEVQDLTLTYDAAADITAITDNLDAARSQSFGYDAVGRLTYASGPYGNIDYTYDLVGNRTHRTIDDGTITDEVYAYTGGSHRLANVTVGSAVRDFGYTEAGSMSSDTRAGTTLSLAYDNAGRLASVTEESQILPLRQYTYDMLQHRVREVRTELVGLDVTTLLRSYVYDLAGHLIAEYATPVLTPQVLREYIWLGNTPVAMIDHTAASGAQLLAIHTDHLGRPQKLTNAAQAVVWDGQFDPFGEEHAVVGTTDMPLRFPGQEWDAATALSQNWNRDYDPTLGRYIESDPIGLGGGASTYTYVLNDPMDLIDSTGRLPDLSCAWDLGSNRKFPKGTHDKYKHCVVSCEIAQECGVSSAIAAGLAKEILDAVDIPIADKKSHDCDAEDITANNQGHSCGVTTGQDCSVCCMATGFTP